MSEDHNLTAEVQISWYKTHLIVFIAGSIAIGIVLVVVSMFLYSSSGAAQLDLSRPGYKAVQDKVERSDTFKSFPASGQIDSKSIAEFQKLYAEQVKNVTTVDVFNPNVLEDTALGTAAPGTTPDY